MQDDKEYRDALDAINYTGSTNAVLNKLGKLSSIARDHKVGVYCDYISHVIRDTPAWQMTSNFRVLSTLTWKRHDTDYTEYETELASFKTYLYKCIASKVPQWQILATQAGWTPPLPLLQNS